MDNEHEAPQDELWREYGGAFREFDDLTLARWLAQTLGQLKGRAWRLSHPLVGAFRLAAQVGHDRGIWQKRLATVPREYWEAACCRAPILPLLTRDVAASGLICQHCGNVAVDFADLPEEAKQELKDWAADYEAVHAVAHWDDAQRKQVADYDQSLEEAATRAEQLLTKAALQFAPKLLDHYPSVIWEDQDECLEVRPEDLEFS